MPSSNNKGADRAFKANNWAKVSCIPLFMVRVSQSLSKFKFDIVFYVGGQSLDAFNLMTRLWCVVHDVERQGNRHSRWDAADEHIDVLESPYRQSRSLPVSLSNLRYVLRFGFRRCGTDSINNVSSF
jgi:hypothetical protein